MDNEDRLNLLNLQTGLKNVHDARNAKLQQQKLDAIHDELKRQRMGPKCPVCKGPLEKEHQGQKCMHCREDLRWVHGVPCVPADEKRLLAEFKKKEEEEFAKQRAAKEKSARELANRPICFGCNSKKAKGSWSFLNSEKYSSYRSDYGTERGSVNYCTECYAKAYPSWFVFSSLALFFGVILAFLGYVIDKAF